MIPGVTTFGEAPTGEFVNDTSQIIGAKSRVVFDDPDATLIFVLRATPYDPAQLITVTGLPHPSGVPVEGPEFTVIGGERTVYLSDRGYHTKPTEAPANTILEGRLVSPYNFAVSLFDGDEPGPNAQGGFGEITARNGDGGLDSWLGYGWDGRTIEVLAGLDGFELSEFATIFRGTAQGIEADEQDLTLRLRDRRFIFDRPIQTEIYGGAGGLDGDANLAGQGRPMAFGRVRNVEPVIIDEAQLVYQVHDGPINAVDAVRDRGVPLVLQGDVPDVFAATVTAGQYVTDLARGVFRLGAAPAGLVTADVEGDALGGYTATTAGIVRRIATTRLGGDSLDPAAEVDGAAFAALDVAQPAKVGYYVRAGGQSASDVLNALLAGIGGWWTFLRDGRLSVARLEEPGVPTFTLDASQVAGSPSITRLPAPLPAWRTRVGWRPMWRVQGAEEVAGSVAAADKALFANQRRFATSKDESVRTRRRLARDVEVAAFFDDEADAAAEAARRAALFGPDRLRFQVPLRPQLFKLSLGQTVAAGLSRLGLSNDRRFVITGKTEDAATGDVTVDLWG